MHEYFAGPLEVLGWARDEIEKFKVSAQAFIDGYKPELFAEMDLAAQEVVHGYVLTEELPGELRRLGYYVVSNLRNALDQAMHAASRRLETAHPKKTNFPVAETPERLESQFQSPTYKGIPSELHPIIRSFHPYWETPENPDGNTILRSLLEVANPNKHRSPIKIWIGPQSVSIRTMVGVKSFEIKRIGENKIEMFRTFPAMNYEFDADVEIAVAFDGGQWINGRVAAVVFSLQADSVEHIINALRDETDRILVERGKAEHAAHG